MFNNVMAIVAIIPFVKSRFLKMKQMCNPKKFCPGVRFRLRVSLTSAKRTIPLNVANNIISYDDFTEEIAKVTQSKQ